MSASKDCCFFCSKYIYCMDMKNGNDIKKCFIPTKENEKENKNGNR